MYAQHPAQAAAAFYPPAAKDNAAFYTNDASIRENHARNIDCCHNTQAQKETESIK